MAVNGLRGLVPFCIVAFACGQRFLYTGGDVQYRVVLDIFSGRPNPTCVIDRSHPLYTQIAIGVQRTPPSRPRPRLGYRGFYIESTNAFRQRAYKYIGAGSNLPLERMLFDSNPIPPHVDVRRHFMNYMEGTTMYRKTNRPMDMRGPFKVPSVSGFVPICTYPSYDPDNWNYPTTVNNCYNYATQRRNNTFAQPGRAGGHTFDNLTALNVMEAALRDGFIYLGNSTAKQVVCPMALFIETGFDFHWYRLDNNNHWSHKIGKGAVTNKDNAGNIIIDPRLANTGNYKFVSFVGNHWNAQVM